MKKDYDFFVTYQNTPHLLYYTWVIGISVFSTGLNLILSWFFARSRSGAGELWTLIVGILFFTLVPVFVTDNRKADRGLAAAVGAYVVLLSVTVFLSHFYYFPLLFIIFGIETVLIAGVIFLLSIKKRRQGSERYKHRKQKR